MLIPTFWWGFAHGFPHLWNIPNASLRVPWFDQGTTSIPKGPRIQVVNTPRKTKKTSIQFSPGRFEGILRCVSVFLWCKIPLKMHWYKDVMVTKSLWYKMHWYKILFNQCYCFGCVEEMQKTTHTINKSLGLRWYPCCVVILSCGNK